MTKMSNHMQHGTDFQNPPCVKYREEGVAIFKYLFV